MAMSGVAATVIGCRNGNRTNRHRRHTNSHGRGNANAGGRTRRRRTGSSTRSTRTRSPSSSCPTTGSTSRSRGSSRSREAHGGTDKQHPQQQTKRNNLFHVSSPYVKFGKTRQLSSTKAQAKA